MADLIMVQVRYKKGIFICSCGQTDVVDWNVSGGNTYENNCSVCGKWNNNFIPHDGCLSYSQSQYNELSSEDIVTAKKNMVDSHINEIKNPPTLIEPSISDYQSMIDGKLAEVEYLTMEMAKKSSKNDVLEIKEKIDDKANSAQKIADSKG